MPSHHRKLEENKSQSLAPVIQQKGTGGTFQFVDNRAEMAAQRKMQAEMNGSPQVREAIQLKAMTSNTTHERIQIIQHKVRNPLKLDPSTNPQNPTPVQLARWRYKGKKTDKTNDWEFIDGDRKDVPSATMNISDKRRDWIWDTIQENDEGEHWFPPEAQEAEDAVSERADLLSKERSGGSSGGGVVGNLAGWHIHLFGSQSHLKRGKDLGTRIDFPGTKPTPAKAQEIIDALTGTSDDAVACRIWLGKFLGA